MTLIQSSQLFRIYVNPGTDDDGYIEPEWTVPFVPDWSWEGGRGDWTYLGRRAVDDQPPRVYMFRMGKRGVELIKDIAEGNPLRNPPT